MNVRYAAYIDVIIYAWYLQREFYSVKSYAYVFLRFLPLSRDCFIQALSIMAYTVQRSFTPYMRRVIVLRITYALSRARQTTNQTNKESIRDQLHT